MKKHLVTLITSLLNGIPLLMFLIYISYSLEAPRRKIQKQQDCYSKCDVEIFRPCWDTEVTERRVTEYKSCNEECGRIE